MYIVKQLYVTYNLFVLSLKHSWVLNKIFILFLCILT